MLCYCARKQIMWYFSIPIVVAIVGSVFGIYSLLDQITYSSMKGNLAMLFITAIPILFVLF